MKNCDLFSCQKMKLFIMLLCLPLLSTANNGDDKKVSFEYKGSKVMYFGDKQVSKEDLMTETKLIDIADRRFEAKWLKKDHVGISEEYTVDAIFMKPGLTPKHGREEIGKVFAGVMKGIDRITFFQHELEFYGDLKSAYQRAHMVGYVNGKKDFIFEGSYIVLWKKVDGNWLIHYDMFNADVPTGSNIYYSGKDAVSTALMMEEARQISVADRRFEVKWRKKDHIGISEEYTEDAVFMTPGAKPLFGRKAIGEKFATITAGIDRITFFQDDLEFLPGMKSAFQRAHMEGFVNGVDKPVFKGSYTVLWKKVDGNWLIQYDMFNADE